MSRLLKRAARAALLVSLPALLLIVLLGAAMAAEIPVTTGDDVIADDGLCSLREAIWSANTDSAIGGCVAGDGVDTVILGAGVYSVSIPSTSAIGRPIEEGAIEITGSLTIQGAGAAQTTIQGTDTLHERDALLRLSGSFDPAQVEVLITGVTLSGGRSGAIANFGDELTIRDSRIVSNVGGGGLVSGRGSTVTLVSTLVAHNSSSTKGGGIHTAGTAILTDVTVTANQSASDGGGILVEGILVLSNTTVSDNLSQVGIGGGIGPANNNSDTHIALFNSTITNNEARIGGGIATNGSRHELVVDNSRILYNTANLPADTSMALLPAAGTGGGGISSSGLMTITGSEIAHNSSGNAGGGIVGKGLIQSSVISGNTAFHGGGIAATGSITIEQSTIAGNRATNDDPAVQAGGGGVAIRSLFQTLTISNSTIENNEAGYYGGGVVVLLSHAAIADSTVAGNVADVGGGIANAGVMTITNGNILDNHARQRGAGVGNSSRLWISGGRLAGNTAVEVGGGIGSDGGTHFTITVPLLDIYIGIGHTWVDGALIEENRAGRGAGIGTGGVFTLTNAILRNNVAGVRGGGISVGNGELTVSDTEIRGNTAGIGGGIFHTFESQYGDRPSHTTLENVTIRNNTAITEGGGVVVAGDSLTLTNSALFLNSAPHAPGLLVVDEGEGDPGTVVLAHTDLANGGTGNCTVDGGVIVSEGGNASSDTSCEAYLDGPDDQNNVDIPIPGDAAIYLPLLVK